MKLFPNLSSISMDLKRSCALSLLLCSFISALYCPDLDNGTPVAPIADSKRHVLLSARVWPFSEHLCTTFHTSPCCSILTFGRLSFADHPRAFFSSGDYSTTLFRRLRHFWPSGDFCHNLHIFSSDLFLLGPCNLLQISFVMGAYCFLFWCRIFFCVYNFVPWMDHNAIFSVSM